MRRAWTSLGVALVALTSCSKHPADLQKKVDAQCQYLQSGLQSLSQDFHKALSAGDSNPPVLSLSTRSWESRVTESSRLNIDLMFCVEVRALDAAEDARVSSAFSGACDQYRSTKLEDASAAVDHMLAELTKLNAAPLRD